MAKVMISLPDELLERIDARARSQRKTRSGLLRELAERELGQEEEQRRAALDRLRAIAEPHGGGSVEFIREMRNSR